MHQKYSLLEAFFSYFLLNLSAILDFRELETRYDKINVRNGFLMLKLVKYDFWNLKRPDFLTTAILECILPPYAPYPRWFVVSYGLFRVSTVGECYKNLVISMLHAPKKPTSSHFSAIIWLNLSAILDFGVLEMSYDQINVRNGFLVFKLVKTDFLITLIAKN